MFRYFEPNLALQPPLTLISHYNSPYPLTFLPEKSQKVYVGTLHGGSPKNWVVFKCSSVQVFKCSSVQVFKCSSVQVFKCSSIQVFIPFLQVDNQIADFSLSCSANLQDLSISISTFVTYRCKNKRLNRD